MTESALSIIHLVNHCRLGHGNVHAAVDLACIQANQGAKVIFGSEGGDFESLLRAEGVQIDFIKQRSKNPFTIIKNLIKLIRIIRHEKIDIVHAHMMSGAAIGYLATRITGSKLITTVHNSFDTHSIIMNLGDKIVAVSDSDKNLLINRGFKSKKLSVIVNGPFNGARLRATERSSWVDLKRPSITTVCGLHSRKGVKYLIEAFQIVQKHTQCHLNIVGDGPDRQDLENLARKTGYFDRIVFHGSLANPNNVLHQSDIFVLASISEPLGLVNIEARIAGCAIIASDVGGISQALDGGEAGILVPPHNSELIAKEIIRLLMDKNELVKWRSKSKLNIEKFDIIKFYHSYLRVYYDINK